jgi:hypothetical protein
MHLQTPFPRAKASAAMAFGWLCAMALAAEANPIAQLPGRWSGAGSIKLANGKAENLKCVATNFVTDGGVRVAQNLRCASPSYRIDAKALLLVRGTQVTGSWEERQHAQTGAVAGKVTSNGFALQISGAHFTAALHLTSSGCRQAISISPKGFDIARISIGLGKC